MRVVLDTNVVISALIWSGTPYRLLQAAAVGDIALFTSPALVAELADVLSRPHLEAGLIRQRTTVQQALALYEALAIRVLPGAIPRIARDADDDHVLACALAARANAIVSGDADLLALGSHEGIPILTPAQCLARMEVA